jgi:hypothetical protein
MLATGPWYASPLAGLTFAIGGVVIGAVGCLLTIWFARAARTRRRLIYTLESDTPLLASHPDARGELEVRVRGHAQPVSDPHIITISLRCAGPTDIRPSDFISDEPLVIKIGADVVKLIGDPSSLDESIKGQTAQIAPTLIRARSSYLLTLLTDGSAQLSAESSIADVRVEEGSPEKLNLTLGGLFADIATAAVANAVSRILP